MSESLIWLANRVEGVEFYEKAACTGMQGSKFFSYNKTDRRICKEMCEQCPVQKQCESFASEQNLIGFWGGLTHEERKTNQNEK